MSFINNYSNHLKYIVSIIEIITYTVAVIIISISIIYSIFIFVKEFNNVNLAFEDTRLSLGESISLALSFILAIEILKIFYIKNYKQLIIIVVLTLLKLTINYFLTFEIDNIQKKRNLIKYNHKFHTQK
jgi:uncharacterized membrane protein